MPVIAALLDHARRFASRHMLLQRARYARLTGEDFADRLRRRQDPGLPPKAARDFVGGGDFRATGQEFLGHAAELADFEPTDRVVEVGSGIGRIAMPIAEALTTGTYDGLEIVRRGVTWCDRNITAAHPNCRFHHADIANATYNRGGRMAAEQYRFPFADDCFDLALLTSVFTHLLTPAVDHYLGELARVLGPGGRLMATFYLANEESDTLMAAGRSQITFPYEAGGAHVQDPAVPENAVAFDEDKVRTMLDRHGFELREPIHYGTWCDRPGPSTQDILVAIRR